MIVYETQLYTVVLLEEEARIDHNYCVVNKKNGCVEAELRALPNAIEAALIFQSKLDSYLAEEEAKADVGKVVQMVRADDGDFH